MFISGIADEAGQDIQAQIRAHKDLGLEHIELRMVDDKNICCMPDEDFEAVYRAVSEAGLQVSCLASKIGDWSRPITGDPACDFDDLKRAIPRMKRLGTKFIRIMSWPNDKEKPVTDHAWRIAALARLNDMVKIASDANIVLAHENCSGWGGISEKNNVALLDEIPDKSLGVLFDTGNPPTYGQDSWEWYVAVKDRIVYVHIKDAKKVDGQDVYTLPGQGDGSVRKIVGHLLLNLYNGGFSLEPHLAAVIHKGQTVPDPADLYRSYVDYGREFITLMDSLKKALNEII